MTKYDIIFEQLQDKVNSGELTVEDAEVLNEVAFEKYGNEDFNDKKYAKFMSECVIDVMCDDIFVEGENIEYHDIFNSCKQNVKKYTKLYKTYMKNCKFKEARSIAKDIKDEIIKARQAIEKLESSVSSSLLSYVIESCLLLSKMLVAAVSGITISAPLLYGGIIGIILVGASTISSIKDHNKDENELFLHGKETLAIAAFAALTIGISSIVKDIIKIKKSCKKSKEITVDDINIYKLKLIDQMKKLEKQADKLISGVDEAENKIKKVTDKAKEEEKNIKKK